MIHKFKQGGFYFIIDVYSGAVHVVDELSYRICDYAENENPPALSLEEKECYDELIKLKRDGLLFSEDSYAPFADKIGPAPIKSMCLNIAHDCNLRCEYCFAAKGDFGRGRCLMSEEVALSAIDFLIANSGSRHNLELDFFGGEPLMNFDTVKKTVEYARSIEKKHNKNFRFTITTNGLNLNDEIIEFINREMSNVVLSLDGRREVRAAMMPSSRNFKSLWPAAAIKTTMCAARLPL